VAQNDKPYIVYKLTSPSKKVYIGITCQSIKKRFENGRGYSKCPVMHGAIKKYGWENFTHEILFDGLTKDQAEEKEIELIKAYKSTNREYGYNIENGGNTYGTHSEETKRKISEGNKGKVFSEESKRKRIETIQKNGGFSGERNAFYGRHHSEKVKREHSEFMKGNQYNKGHHHTEEFKKYKSAQMKAKYGNGKNPRCKTVIHLDETGNVIERYGSLRAAAEKVGRSPSWLCVAIHDSNNKEWKYEERVS